MCIWTLVVRRLLVKHLVIYLVLKLQKEETEFTSLCTPSWTVQPESIVTRVDKVHFAVYVLKKHKLRL